jgi:hypothetical protein
MGANNVLSNKLTNVRKWRYKEVQQNCVATATVCCGANGSTVSHSAADAEPIMCYCICWQWMDHPLPLI